MRNVQARTIDASAAVLGPLLNGLSGPDDRLWPVPAWPELRLDRGLAVGSRGGHGPIRYHVVEYEPGQRIRLAFEPSTQMRGYHELRIDAGGLVHEIHGRTYGRMLLLWPVAIRWLHEALVQDLLENAERFTTGRVARPARHSPWVRLLRRLGSPRPQETVVTSSLQTEGTDLADAWYLPLGPAMPTDPQVWADAVVRDLPAWVAWLLRLRNALVGLIGVPPSTRAVFDAVSRTDEEVRFSAGEVHLDFATVISVGAGRVVMSTVATARNRRGRLYLAIVRQIHPAVVRAMLARAHRRLAVKTLLSRRDGGPAPARQGTTAPSAPSTRSSHRNE